MGQWLPMRECSLCHLHTFHVVYVVKSCIHSLHPANGKQATAILTSLTLHTTMSFPPQALCALV